MVKRLNTIDYGDTIRPGFNGAANIITSGNITAGLYFGDGGNLSNVSAGGSDTLEEVVNLGNTTSNTVQFSNTVVSFVTSGKIGVANSNPTESLTVTGNLKLTDDGGTLFFGAENDFQIYHDGGNTELANGFGDLIFRQDAGDTFMRVNGGTFKVQNLSPQNDILVVDTANQRVEISKDLNLSNIILNTGLTSIADMSTSNLSIDMEGYSYRTFAVNTAGQNITDLSITNAITGSQGVVFITATTSSCTISKPFATSTYKSGNASLTLPTGNVAALSFVYNGTNFFCNTAEYI